MYKHKHLILIFDHEHRTRFKHNYIINIRLPNYTKVFGQKSVLYISLNLRTSFKININNFNSFITFKKYIKHLELVWT